MIDVMDKRRASDDLVRAKDQINDCLKECCNKDLEVKASLGPEGMKVFIYDKDSIYHEEENYD